jgi:hypothetical protein
MSRRPDRSPLAGSLRPLASSIFCRRDALSSINSDANNPAGVLSVANLSAAMIAAAFIAVTRVNAFAARRSAERIARPNILRRWRRSRLSPPDFCPALRRSMDLP